MKRTLCFLLVLALMVSMITSAFAAEGMEGGEQPQESETQTTVTVGTLDELETAIAAAEDGDTIAVSAEITLDGVTLQTGKDITLVRADSYESGSFFRLKNSAVISGFRMENYKSSTTAVCESSAEIENCYFIGDSDSSETFIKLYALSTSNAVSIHDCSFSGAAYSAIYSKNNVQLTITNCIFSENCSYTQGGAIRSEGTLILEGCTISGNSAVSGGGVYCSGDLTITNCQFSGNQIQNEKFGTDILSFGTLNITDDPQDGEGYYEESTGVKVELPLADYTNTAKLIYLTDEQATEYFAPDPAPDEPDEGEPETPTETPTEPPEQPDNGEDGDTPTEPEEPPTTPEQPQDKPDSGDDDDDDYEPPVYRPVHPIKPSEPEPQPEPAPTLICNNAVVDTSRSVVLLGYGDGLLYEDDPLTRAQLATIVYRLLDDDSIAQYDTDGAAQFKDVAPDAWCYRYVQTINRAGIVLGVGEGNYAPNGLVTWAQTITILSRFVEPQDYELQHIQYDGWALNAVQTAVALGWITDSAEFNPDAIISRGQLVQLVNGILEQYR